MSELGGLWTQGNNSTCTEKCQSLQSVEVGHYTEEEEEEECLERPSFKRLKIQKQKRKRNKKPHPKTVEPFQRF